MRPVNSIQKGKTDQTDTVKLACKVLDSWTELKEYLPEDELRQALKICNISFFEKAVNMGVIYYPAYLLIYF